MSIPSRMTLLENATKIHRTMRTERSEIVAEQIARQEEQKRIDAERKVAAGRRSWSMLHRYYGTDPETFFEAWQFTIPAMCDCRNEFKKIVADFPPDFSSPEAFWLWGVEVHNRVNGKLNKPLFTVEEARNLWRRDGTKENESTSAS